jgi:hypothetical protein
MKKYLFGIVRPKLNLLPLNLFLKNKKMNFTNFIKLLTNDNSVVIEIDQKTILSSVVKFI